MRVGHGWGRHGWGRWTELLGPVVVTIAGLGPGSATAAQTLYKAVPLPLEARGINGAGQVAGVARTASGDRHAFLWDAAARMKDLGTLGGPSSEALGINAAGEVVGSADTAAGASHAFLWDAATGMKDLGTLAGLPDSYADGINAAGQVVGEAAPSFGELRAFLYDHGAMVDLNTLLGANLGAALTGAVAINDSGQIVASTGEDVSDLKAYFLLQPA